MTDVKIWMTFVYFLFPVYQLQSMVIPAPVNKGICLVYNRIHVPRPAAKPPNRTPRRAKKYKKGGKSQMNPRGNCSNAPARIEGCRPRDAVDRMLLSLAGQGRLASPIHAKIINHVVYSVMWRWKKKRNK